MRLENTQAKAQAKVIHMRVMEYGFTVQIHRMPEVLRHITALCNCFQKFITHLYDHHPLVSEFYERKCSKMGRQEVSSNVYS